ncbi:protein DpdE [Candidatus Venteria ishoeyi]|uniref:RNA polymerase-associated protein RapA n=1 Tax=Candidatus Venteria ishoeyi TaxID=1899563 RepID=A0A1H6FBP0_9GAMM|nr:protein DpdE [Candidatus Venteria ishoeyi]SEH06415.1 RNA polymerase-associated protein RapA [Candidatus Venteria ishoeyi]
MRLGIFVSPTTTSDIGKLVAVEGRRVTVRFFYSIMHQEEQDYALEQIKHFYLHPHTRVYIRINEEWRVGRITNYDQQEDQTIEYDVRFPNRELEYFSETELEVRCLRPLVDPTEVLAYAGIETQYFHDRRKRIIETLTDMRAVSQGMTGLMSASIEFIPHQLEVARRVLEDPIQRYLLADEVGMGKTVETGIIIRQCLLDKPDSQIAVFVPPHLVSQWQAELEEKFAVHQFPGLVSVFAYKNVHHAQCLTTLDLVVIDEAHHVMVMNTHLQNSIVETIKQLARQSERLLLLSATPVLGHEQTTLAMLNLLDPDSHRLDELDKFVEKVHKRQDYGRLLLGLRPDAASFVLKQRAKQVSQLFPDDNKALDLANKLLTAIEQKATEITAKTCVQLRTHIAETYRIHHRVIRTRRVDTPDWVFASRGAERKSDATDFDLSHVVINVDPDSRVETLIDLLDQWSAVSRSALEEPIEPSQELIQAKRYIQLFEAISCGVDTVKQIVSEWETQSEEEQAVLQALQETIAESPETSRYTVIAEQLQVIRQKFSRPGSTPKIVVFSSAHTDIVQLATTLSITLERAEFHVLLEDNPEMIEGIAKHFFEDFETWLLLCDRNGEEGQNLHFADAIVHLDLPFSPARLEQRIGRLDRFGRTKPVPHWVLLPSDQDYSPWFAWYTLLAQGFGLFNQSISDVQFLLEQLEEKLMLQVYRLGSQGLFDMINQVRQQLQEERERLEEQYALDKVTMQEGRTEAFFNALEDFEADEPEIQTTIDTWLFETLKFHRHQNHDEQAFSTFWSRSTLVPRYPWENFFQVGLNTPVTYKRRIATKKADTSLLRSGNPLIDALEKFMRWEDRGTAFATWRINPDWIGQDTIWTGFRLCYLVQADVGQFEENFLAGESIAALQRRADGYLPPRMMTLHLDSELQEVTDDTMLALLERPYSSNSHDTAPRDYNLGSRQEALFQVIEPSFFQDLCKHARTISEQRLRDNAEFQAYLNTAYARAEEMLGLINERLQYRQAMQQQETGISTASLERDIAFNRLLLQGIEIPSLHLDAIGFFIIAGYPPNSELEI